MPWVQEIPPLMVLAEDGDERQTFRFRGRRWALLTFLIAIGLFLAFMQAHATRQVVSLQVGLAAFGALFLFSTAYSLGAEQWLRVDGSSRSIRFHKRNLYGSVDWERPGSEFARLRVFRPSARGGKAMTWSIVLVGLDGGELSIGENEFGSLHRERALWLARKVGRLAGIEVVES